MKRRHLGWALALACVLAVPAIAQVKLPFPDYLSGLPAATSTLGDSDKTVIVQGGAAKSIAPSLYFMNRDGTNAGSAQSLRSKILPAPTNGYVLTGDGSDWTAAPATGGGADTSLSNVVLPASINGLLANRNGQTFPAENYLGAVSGVPCTWDATHDVGDCINAALAAAYNSGNVLGKVVVPAGEFGVATTIIQTNKNGVIIEGAGGPGWYGVCNTKLKWIGSAGGTMIKIGPATQNVLNASVNSMCVDGNSASAAIGVQIRGLSDAIFRDVRVSEVSSIAWDLDSNAAANGGTHDVWFWETGAALTTAGAINATGWKIGRGSAAFSTDTFRVHWLGGFVQYQNGTGFECGGMDSSEVLGMDIQPSGGGTGASLHLLGDPTGLMCRSNRFTTTGGFGRTTATRPVADTDTIPSQNNYIYQNHESQSSDNTPLVNGTATLTWDDNKGNHFSNATTTTQTSGATTLGYAAISPILTLYRTSSANFTRNRLDLSLQDSNGVQKAYAGLEGGINSNTAGAHQGWMSFYTANAGALIENARLRPNGGLELGSGVVGKSACTGCLAIGNATPIQAADNTGTLRSMLQIFSDNKTYLEGAQAGGLIRSNLGTATALSWDAAGNVTASHDLFADSIKAVNSGSAAHTINNDGTNTDVNAPSGNLDLKVANSAVLRVTSAGATMQTGTITVPTGVASGDAVNVAQLNSVASGVVTHASAAAATTANLTATYANGASGVGATLTNSGAQAAFAVDGYSASLNDRILVKNQSTTFQNGIYTVTTVGTGATNWVLTRATDFDAASANEVASGASVIVVSGTVGAKTQWVETGQGPFTIGTTAIVFDQTVAASSSGTVSAGTASQLGYYAANGTTISGLTTANNGVLVTSAGGVPSISSTIPAATQANITQVGTIGAGVWGGTKITQAFGGTNADLSATGGPSQVLKQVSAGAPITVGTLSCADLSNDAASCATDATNASNISSGTLAAARGGAGTISGALKGDGAGVVSQAACADLSNGATGCSTVVGTAATANTGTSGATVPLLNGTNTASGVNTFSNTTDATSATTGAVITSGGLGVAKSIYTTGTVASLGGSLRTTGSLPTVTSCGTSPSVTGTNVAGRITIGSGTVTACTLNFTASFWASAPSCVFTLIGATIASTRITSISSSSMVMAISASGNTGINYVCIGI